MDEGKLAEIKLTTGEGIVCMVVRVEDNDHGGYNISIKDPLRVEASDIRRKDGAFKVKFVPWFLTTDESNFDIDVCNILAISKVESEEVLQNYLRYFRKRTPGIGSKRVPLDDKNQSIGYLGSVKSFQKSLEEIFKLDYKPNE